MRGLVAVDRIPARGTKGPWPSRVGYDRYNVCSSARGFTRELSPMLLGPIEIPLDTLRNEYGIVTPLWASCVENVWQGSKVWPREVRSDGRPARSFYERRARLWFDPKGHRHTRSDVKKKCGNIPACMWWQGRSLSYLEGRREIYCPIYAEYVRHTDAYKTLAAEVARGANLLLVGYDGYDRGDRTWRECFSDTTRPFGHEMVLGCMLEGVDPMPWEEREEPDPKRARIAGPSTASGSTTCDRTSGDYL